MCPFRSLVFDDPEAAAQGFDFDFSHDEFSLDTPAGMSDAKYMKLAAALRSTIEASGHSLADVLPFLSSPVPSPAQSAVPTTATPPSSSIPATGPTAEEDGPAFDDSAEALDLDLAFFTSAQPHHPSGARAPT